MRLTENELNMLMRYAAGSGLSPQNYLLSLLKDGKPKELPQLEFHEILKNLRQINKNMNQIAMKANATGFIDAKAYRENNTRLQEQIGIIIEGLY